MFAAPRTAHQRRLGPHQVEPFYANVFARDQVRDFLTLNPTLAGALADMGGGCGHFVRALTAERPAFKAMVVDVDDASLRSCARAGIAAEKGDAVRYTPKRGQTGCFNLILHHLVGDTERRTRTLQLAALSNWQGRGVFVNEYVYDCRLGDLAGRLIYTLTSSATLASFVRMIGAAFPALKANTCGVGVRFRSRRGWERLFSEAGFDVAARTEGEEDVVHWLLRPLVRSIRRDSFMLKPRITPPAL
jgi:hypothetical protein